MSPLEKDVPPRKTDRQNEEVGLTAFSSHGDLPLRSLAAPVPLCSCSRGNAPLQHRLQVEGRESSSAQTAQRGKAGIWHFHHCHVLCSNPGVRATALWQCRKPDLRKAAVICTTNLKSPLSLHKHNPQQQDTGLEDLES